MKRQKEQLEPQFFTPQQYEAAGCMQFEAPDLARGLWVHTGGIMCNGCPQFQGGRCKAFLELAGSRMIHRAMPKPPTETVRDEAARRGISIKQVRRERRDAVA